MVRPEDNEGGHHHPEPNGDAAVASSSPFCDWRLSRAAREIVRVHLELAWRTMLDLDQPRTHAYDDRPRRNTQHRQEEPPPLSFDNVWQLLEESLSMIDAADRDGSGSDDENCTLLPERDVGRYYELQRRRVEASMLKLVSKPVRQASLPGATFRDDSQPRQLSRTLHKCGICNRTFTSRYYLDRHWEQKHPPPSPFWRHRHQHHPHYHPHDSSNFVAEDSTIVCPASDWCGHFLTRRDCHDAALELEPYYGPGSAGERAGDRDAVHRRLVKEAHNLNHAADDDDRHYYHCSSSSASDQTTRACHEMIRNCFGEGDDDDDSSSFSLHRRIGQQLNASLCNTKHRHHSCDGLGGRMLHLLAAQQPGQRHRSSLLHPDHAERTWREAWRSEEEHFGVTTGSVLVILAVLCFYAYHCFAPPHPHPTAAVGTTAKNALQPNKRLSRRKLLSHRGATSNETKLKLPPLEPPTTHVKQH